MAERIFNGPSCAPWIPEEDIERTPAFRSRGGGECTQYYRTPDQRAAVSKAIKIVDIEEHPNPGKVEVTTIIMAKGICTTRKVLSES